MQKQHIFKCCKQLINWGGGGKKNLHTLPARHILSQTAKNLNKSSIHIAARRLNNQ